MLSVIISGCKEWTTIKVVNQYNFPVRVYDASNSPNYPPELLGEIAPNAASNFQIAHIGDGASYHFVVHKKGGRVIKEIVEPSKQLNSSVKDDALQLKLTPLAP